MRENRTKDELRNIEVEKNWNKWAEGSAWVKWGDNIISVTASVSKRIPKFLMGQKSGWLACEYRMLPRANDRRKIRNENMNVPDSRQTEISRLLGRVLRNAVDLKGFPHKTIWIDCDVIQADGGTRIASLLGGFIALLECLKHMKTNGVFTELPVKQYIAGLSVAMLDGEILIDPDYEEDFSADADINIIMNEDHNIIEILGGAEGRSHSPENLTSMIERVKVHIDYLVDLEKKVLSE